MRYTITDETEAKPVVEYFNSFHDGFLKSAQIVSGNKFQQQMPWEPRREYLNNVDRLEDTGLLLSDKTGIFLQLAHYNYDCPNILPTNLILLYISDTHLNNCDLFLNVGNSILDFSVQNGDARKLISFCSE